MSVQNLAGALQGCIRECGTSSTKKIRQSAEVKTDVEVDIARVKDFPPPSPPPKKNN